MSSVSAQRQATRTTLAGICLDLVLGIGKVSGGLVSQSFALLVDGIHSFSDAIADIFMFIMANANKTSEALNTDQNLRNHSRVEVLGNIALGVIYFVVAGIIIFSAIQRIADSTNVAAPTLTTLVIALISIASKEWIYQYTFRVADRVNSKLLKANAWHNRLDSVPTIVVVIGLVAAQQGYLWMDALAGIFVALIITKIAWELCTDSLKELVEASIPESRRGQLEACIKEVDGILGLATLRGKQREGKLVLEAQLSVDPKLSVADAQALGDKVSRAVCGSFSDISWVYVNFEPALEANLRISESKDS